MGSWRELAAFAALTLIWGSTWAAIRIGLEGIPPLAGVAIRFLLAGAVLLAVALARRVRLGTLPGERRLWLSNTLATFVVPYAVIYWAEQWVPSGLASVLFATFPIWVVIVGRWLLPAERHGRLRLLGVALGFAGVAVIFSEDFDRLGGPQARWPAFALLAAAAISASGSIALRRWGAGVPRISLAAVPMLATGVVVGLLALALERRTIALSPAPVLATLYLALFGSAVTFMLYFWLIERRSALAASLVAYTAPVVAVLIGTLGLDEPLTWRVVGGGCLVLGGVAGVLAGGSTAPAEEAA